MIVRICVVIGKKATEKYNVKKKIKKTLYAVVERLTVEFKWRPLICSIGWEFCNVLYWKLLNHFYIKKLVLWLFSLKLQIFAIQVFIDVKGTWVKAKFKMVLFLFKYWNNWNWRYILRLCFLDFRMENNWKLHAIAIFCCSVFKMVYSSKMY